MKRPSENLSTISVVVVVVRAVGDKRKKHHMRDVKTHVKTIPNFFKLPSGTN